MTCTRPGSNLQTVSDVRDAVRRRRKSALATLQSAIRQLEQEPLWATTSCLELTELLDSMLAARDELARRIDGKGQRLLDREAARIHSLAVLGKRLEGRPDPDEAAGIEEARGRLEAGIEGPVVLVGSRTHGEGFDAPQP